MSLRRLLLLPVPALITAFAIGVSPQAPPVTKSANDPDVVANQSIEMAAKLPEEIIAKIRTSNTHFDLVNCSAG